jgi:hypothetical protein
MISRRRIDPDMIKEKLHLLEEEDETLGKVRGYKHGEDKWQ